MGPKNLLSPLLLRLSPMTNTCPSGTTVSGYSPPKLLLEQVGLILAAPFTYSLPPLDGHPVAGHGDHPLDQVLAVGHRRMEHDHVAVLGVAEVVDHPVDEDAVTLLERGPHRHLMDGERLDQEGLHQHGDGEGRRHDDHDLDDGANGALLVTRLGFSGLGLGHGRLGLVALCRGGLGFSVHYSSPRFHGDGRAF